ncbi:MAG: two-component regulator propeller domain-containing protein [Blastocatellia bacterium]
MALLLGGLLCAVLADVVSAQYRFDNWTTEHGLPQNSVLAITQTRDGYLWLATNDGLARFDGVHFTVFNAANTSGLESNRLTTLYEDHNGTLWIGTEDGAVIQCRNSRFTPYSTRHGLPSSPIVGITEDSEWGLLVLTIETLLRWQDDQFVRVQIDAGKSLMSCLDQNGGLWSVSASGIHRFKSGKEFSFPLPATSRLFKAPVDRNLFAVYQVAADDWWIGIGNAGLYRIRQGAITFHGLPGTQIRSLCADHDGNLWIGAMGGLIRYREGKFTTFTASSGLSEDRIRSLYLDREGTVWIGTFNQGLNQLNRKLVRVYGKPDGLVSHNIYPIYQTRSGQAPGGDIWVGTWNGGVHRYRNGVFTNFPTDLTAKGELITALYEDREGKLWVARLERGLGWFVGERFFNSGIQLSTQKNFVVRVIHQDKNGDYWFGTNQGLFKYQVKDQAETVTRYTTEQGLAGNDINAMHEDRQGRLWLGTYGGLSCWQNGRFTSLTEKDGLVSNRVRALYEDQDGSLWIGTYDRGLNRLLNGRLSSFTKKDGLFDDGVFVILEDGRGNLWMSCNRGIYRVSRTQLNDFAAGKRSNFTSIAYGKQDGMLSLECNGGRQPAGIKASDGQLWFPTQHGVAVINPDDAPINPLAPPVLIESCLLDRQTTAFSEELRINPGQANLEINYTGLSFIKADQVRFRYKLAGQGGDWVEAGTRRTAHYSHLSPGAYFFQVKAANSDGVWNELGASLRIVVVPPFYRTWWFTGLALMSLAGVIALLYRLRVAQLQKEHTAKEAFSRQLLESQETFSRRLIESQEAERKRIAAELHDSLGQSLLVIKNRAYLGTLEPEDARGAQEQLNEISEATADAIHQVREIAYYLRPSQLERLGLTTSLEEMLDQVGGSSGILFEVELASLDGVFAPENEINFYRIVQECLNNIVKHSRATTAEVSIGNEAGFVSLLIRDNGQGFSPQAATQNAHNPQSGGFGLTGIAERVRMLGGQLNIDSAPGQGTTVKVQIPIKLTVLVN